MGATGHADQGARDNDRKEQPDITDEQQDIIGEQAPSIISSLPFELLVSILAQIAIRSPRSFVRTLLIGRPFWIPHDSALLWEPICRSIYPELEHGHLNVDDYGGYYNLFHLRPTARFNGVYICVSRYFRETEVSEGTISFIRPRHEVRYYRYFWLRSDGSASSLLCNYAPKQVLGLEGSTSHATTKDAMHGRWSLDADTKRLKITTDGGTKRRHHFHFLLEVASSGGKVHNKLKWRNYWCEEYGTGNKAEFSLNGEGSYYFHKLR